MDRWRANGATACLGVHRYGLGAGQDQSIGEIVPSAVFERLDMTAADYADRFEAITVRLNWRKFAAESWPVERHVVTDPLALSQFHTFFRKSLGRVNPHFLHWIASRQMQVEEVLAKLGRLPRADRTSIEQIAAEFGQMREPVRLTLPTYELGDGQRFIMDGNHRACGLALSGQPFELELYSIAGPVTREALVDLVHCR
jgi:hypothetical protein